MTSQNDGEKIQLLPKIPQNDEGEAIWPVPKVQTYEMTEELLNDSI